MLNLLVAMTTMASCDNLTLSQRHAENMEVLKIGSCECLALIDNRAAHSEFSLTLGLSVLGSINICTTPKKFEWHISDWFTSSNTRSAFH